MWASIRAVIPALNMNYGPFKSRSWKVGKQSFVTRFFSENSVDHEEFQKEAPSLCAEAGFECDAEGVLATWEPMQSLRSFSEAGPIIKLMRFHSINDAWNYHRGEIRRHRFLLRMMAEERTGFSAADLPQGQDDDADDTEARSSDATRP